MLQHRLATPVIQPRMHFFDKEGQPLIGGKVYSLKVGEDIFKPTYRNSEFTAANQNPIQLDQAGSCLVYMRGSVELRVFDRNNVFIESKIVYQQQEQAQFFDKLGKPLAHGKVWTYDYQSTLKKTSYYADAAANPNPVLLDENGKATVYMAGAYRLRQLDKNNVFVGDQDFKRQPAKVLTSKPYPAYFYDGVAASASLINGDQIPLNIGRFSDSAVTSASIESASLWSVFNIGYMPSEATATSASIESASIWSVFNIGYMPVDSTSTSASIESASIQNVVIKHTEKPENVSSSAQLLDAQIENQELNPTPRNINYVADGDVDFTFEADGIGYTYNYYRSLTPMNIASLPTPIVTGLTTKAYTDTSAPSSDFYVRFSANKASSELVGSEIKVAMPVIDLLAEYVDLYMPLTNDFSQVVGNKVLTIRGENNSFVPGGINGSNLYQAGAASCFSFDISNFFNNQPFCIEYYAQTADTGFAGICSFGSTATVTDFSCLTHCAGGVFASTNNSSWTHPNLTTVAPSALTHFAFVFTGSQLRIYAGGIQRSVANLTFNQSKNNANVGKKENFNSSIVNRIQHLRITKGHQRYTANFTPPTDFFYG